MLASEVKTCVKKMPSREEKYSFFRKILMLVQKNNMLVWALALVKFRNFCKRTNVLGN